MIIRKLIIFLLFLSYTFVLGHSIFHHDHHEADLYINSPQFHSSETHGHSDEFFLHDFFKRYNHTGDKEIFTFSQFSHKAKLQQFKIQSEILNVDCLNSDKSPPVSFLPIENSIINSKKPHHSYSGLRAPPIS